MKNKIFSEEIRKKAVNGRLSCAAARKIAEKFNLPYKTIGSEADKLKIKITSCQLGCF
jgi:hypothetical protein